MTAPGWYYRLGSFFKERFGERVIKIPLDVGLTCPNRDGTLSEKGCIFCFNPAFSPAAAERETEGETGWETGWETEKESGNDIRRQIRFFQWKMETRVRHDAAGANTSLEPPLSFVPRHKYLAYFQAYSNTYGSLSLLERLYSEALQAPGIIGLSIATRPDCLGADVLDLLTGLARRSHIWLELGLQSAHDRTLQLINRGHTYACFAQAAEACQGRNLYLCVHLINGLPGEDPSQMLATAKQIATLPVHGVKFHQLQVLAGTPLESLYRQGEVSPLSQAQYLQIVCNQLEVLPVGMAVHRLLAETPRRNLLLAPHWQVTRARFAAMVEDELRRRGTWQGSSSGA